MRSFRLFSVFIVLTSNQIGHHKHKVVVCRFQSVHAARHGFQLCLFLRFGGSGFFCLFLGFSLFSQLFGGVADVPHHRHFLIPGWIRFNTGNIDNLFYNGAAIGKMFDRDVMADLLNSSNRVMVHDFHVIHQPAQCQVRCFG
nr:MAG TPA: hypothetical protein [Caudoviricetes sp.]